MRKSNSTMRVVSLASLMAMGALPTFLTACSSSDDPVNNPEQQELTEIVVTTAIKTESNDAWTQTRGGEEGEEAEETTSITQNSNIVKDETVRVLVYGHGAEPNDVGTTVNKIYNQLYTADGNGNLAFTENTHKMYYPYNDTAVDIIVSHGETSYDETKGEYAITIYENQTEKANYVKSDFIYGSVLNQARTDTIVNVNTKHILSRFTLTVKESEVTKGEVKNITSIQLTNVVKSATFTPDFTKEAEGKLVLSEEEADNVDITLDNYQAVIIPQIFKNDSRLRITTGEGDKARTYEVGLDKEFKGGYDYGYTATLTSTGLKVTTTVTPWVDASAAEVDAELVPLEKTTTTEETKTDGQES
jgi:hypothetical protein